MGKNPAYKALLNDVQLPHPVAADYESEYLSLKKLNLKNYLVR